MFELRSRITIDADAVRVWSILADFAAYPGWNPFITRISGSAAVGSRLEVLIQPAGGKAMTFRPTVLVSEEHRELRWLGRLLVHGLFDGEHRFRIEAQGTGRVLFHQEETFRGLLVPLFRSSLDTGTRQGFETMNAALKARAEG